ncbi:CRISPR-associated helicase/endonuclease Cas3 [endosymbiont of Riftia pachyptila]|uniref:CRISPR-associated helicase Cas3, protein n=1 Tax=endosymbiont of Riftia pachyptila (vent Ph05) TaxID=1048808 RepID=G2DH37_9GAMM|nr:CRISPR-associated helicase/endonuclease Cas3 [endosymbiont of Riftia pachyptila]EGV50073.1 CRISPR-associated helicase Cas3, protein [endosymbiont of Riftia pachyptila (vent Ph05)]
MKETSPNAFGKLQRNEEGIISAWHTLTDHQTDVAACFEHLCRCHNIRRALETTAEQKLQPRDISRLSALVFLHDLGKANSGFQAKRWTRDKLPQEWPLPAGHGIEASKIFSADVPTSLAERLPIEAMDSWGEAVLSLLIASISHHGRPIDFESTSNWNPAIWKPVTDCNGNIIYDPESVLQQIGELMVALYPNAFEPAGNDLPDTPAFGHLFAGLVQLADWISSDTDFFPYAKENEQRTETAPRYAAAAITALGLDTENWRDQINALSPEFAHVFQVPSPYPIQKAMDDPDLGPLVILESETGSGKTEAAIWRYLHLFRTGQVDSLYFALPTRVSATQAYQRIKSAINRIWSTDAPVTVRALPGYASADGQDIKILPDFKVQWPDDPGDVEAQRRWAAESPKRFLAAPIAVGTIDQALLGALQVRHAHLRHALLSRSLLVVDEVHASDPYMTALLERLLKAHLDCGGHALLLSATLGSSARDRYLALAPQREKPAATTTNYDSACTIHYPAISDFSDIRPIASAAPEKTISWTLHDCMDDPEQIARMALDAAGEGAKVLVIRNTVPAAIAVLRALEESNPDPAWLFNVNGINTLHHSRFSRQDRPILDKAIQEQLGKTGKPGPRIVVGTQTLEQSLDLDADLLITDLCPMDVLLQRVGRLHRHHRSQNERPERFQTAQAWVLTPPGHNLTPMLKRSRHGLGRFRNGGGIYDDLRIIEATRRLIDKHLVVNIPEKNRYLVETATHSEQLTAIQDELGEPWQTLAQQVEGDTGAQNVIARLHALNFNEVFGERKDNLFPNDVKIGARLGAEDRLLQFDPALPGPFGAPLKQLPVRHFLVPDGLDLDAQPNQIVQQDGLIEFTLGTTRYRYGRLGLERLTDD